MRGVETIQGKPTHFYQYKVSGPKYYYKKRVTTLRIPFTQREPPKAPRPPPQYYCEYVPLVNETPIERVFARMAVEVQALVNTWLLVFGFRSINDITLEAIEKSFRRQSLIHHPDRGGSEEKYKELGNVRDHLVTIHRMGQAR